MQLISIAFAVLLYYFPHFYIQFVKISCSSNVLIYFTLPLDLYLLFRLTCFMFNWCYSLPVSSIIISFIEIYIQRSTQIIRVKLNILLQNEIPSRLGKHLISTLIVCTHFPQTPTHCCFPYS